MNMPSHNPRMMLSVVVPAYNSEKTIGECLAAVKASEYGDYELIVVDDASSDATAAIAAKYADRLVVHPANRGRSAARNSGIDAARGEILVLIDSDVVVRPDTLAKAAAYFAGHGDVVAITGILSREHPHENFFSQYKNLYMNYIFGKLPERVNFLYGSFHALRKSAALGYGKDVRIADDTALGQELTARGQKIGFVRELEVVHLKRYGFGSLLKNDFLIPCDWAVLFIKYRGWRQLGKSGYAHSPKEQLASVVTAPMILFLVPVAGVTPTVAPLAVLVALTALWSLLNYRFLAFLVRHRGWHFGFLALWTTFLDNLVMASGICCGFAAYIFYRNNRRYTS